MLLQVKVKEELTYGWGEEGECGTEASIVRTQRWRNSTSRTLMHDDDDDDDDDNDGHYDDDDDYDYTWV